MEKRKGGPGVPKGIKKFTAKDKEKFFKKIASRASYLNPELVEEVYWEMLRVMVHELKANGKVVLPDFVTIKLHRRSKPLTGNFATAKPHNMIWYRTDKKLKDLMKFKPIKGLDDTSRLTI